MSIRLISACWDLPIASTPKLVLIALCNHADDNGESCHPSVATISRKCSLGRRQTQRTLNGLVSDGWISIEANQFGGAPGSTKRYRINVERLATGVTHDTGADMTRVSPVTQTGVTHVTGRVSPTTQTGVTHVTQTVNNHKKQPSITKTRANALDVSLPEWLPSETWDEWVEHRRQIKHPMTQLAAEKTIKTLATLKEAGQSPRELIEKAIANGWRGIYGATSTNASRKRPSAADRFDSTNYEGTPDEELPSWAAR